MLFRSADTAKIARLENIINTSQDPEQVSIAKKELEHLSSIGSAQLKVAAATGSESDQIAALLNALTLAVEKGGGSASKSDIQAAVSDELAKHKIDYSDLSDSLKALINSTQKVNITVKQISGLTTSTTSDADFLKKKIVQLILSDAEAKNNVYLYGSAGTGKTYIAQEIANILGYTLITLNCNQYLA